MFDKEMLKGMINERLSEAAGEIFSLFEQAVAEYQREIDRLKKVSEAKRVVVNFREPQKSSSGAHRTQAAGRVENEGNAGSFRCKEEPELVAIKREDEPQMLIADVNSVGNELQPRGQQKANSGGPEEQGSGGEETESVEGDSDTDCDENPFGSDVAKKPFSYSVRNMDFTKIKAHTNAFKAHVDSHAAERLFRCALCGKSFTQKVSLKRHMLTHSGEKPFSCSKCGKKYARKENLMTHVTRDHKKSQRWSFG